jgi:hypothetical protein
MDTGSVGDALDRRAWAGELTLGGYGAHVGVRVSEIRALHLAASCVPFGWKRQEAAVLDRRYSWIVAGPQGDGKVRRFNLLYRDGEQVLQMSSTHDVAPFLEAHLELDLAELATTGIFVHAGVVGWRGRAILMPGLSFSGKTTLVTALVRAGASYYSDEFAVLDQRGFVQPFPRPPTLRNDTEPEVTIRDLLARTGREPLPVGLVVLTRYEPGIKWIPHSVSPGLLALALLENCVSARRRPGDALSAVHHVVTYATALQGSRGEAAEMADHLLSKIV